MRFALFIRRAAVLASALPACAAAYAGDAAPFRQLPELSKEDILVRRPPAFSAYQWSGNGKTIVLDFPDMREQALAFGRVILFIERDGTPKNRVLSVAEMEQWLSDNRQRLLNLTVGNNFRAVELARFFNAVKRQGDRLTAEEQFLHDWLLRMQLLVRDGGDLSAADRDIIVISVPQPSKVDGCASCTVLPAHRESILEHELAHAVFATDAAYRAYALDFWSELDASMRERFTAFLQRRGYDTANRELLANEMHAFLMHTPHAAMFSAAAVGISEDELDALRLRFRTGMAGRKPD